VTILLAVLAAGVWLLCCLCLLILLGLGSLRESIDRLLWACTEDADEDRAQQAVLALIPPAGWRERN
jgi:hypothetical protein